MNATELTASLVGMLFSLLLFAGLYVWTALALSAVFRKSGVEAWHAWVPLLNWANVLQLGGFSPWLVLLSLVPVVNIVFVVVWVLALYRVNNAFGMGIGMTVLGVLLFPVWATVVGWGSARWVGRETDASSRAGLGAGGGVRRSAEQAPTLPPLPSFPSAAAATGTAAPAASPSGFAPAPGFGAPGGQAPTPGYAPAQGFTPPPATGFAPPPAYTPAPAPGASRPAAAPTEPVVRPAAAPADGPFVPDAPTPAAPYAPAGAGESAVPDETLPGVVPPAGGWAPPPLPSRRAAAVARAEAEPAAEGSDPWQGFALDSTDLSGEVTGAFAGAPAPVSAVPPVPVSDVPAVPARPATAPEPSGVDLGITRPPFTRVPTGEASTDDREPWAPARSPMADSDAFPEASGPVSAVIGAPDAGTPLSARSSVSAFHARPEIPDEDDALDHTIIARRKRTDWALVPPTGGPVALTSDVVILGRRPTSDPAFPGAQLVPIQDGTVSKTHARLRLRDDKWYVTDLDSTNGVLFATVMGTEVEVTPGEEVEAGDRFLLGDAEVRLQRSDG